MGYISAISTKIEQILCSRGYTDQLSGLSGSLILLCGTLASFPFGYLAYKTRKPTLICKACGIVVIISLVMMGYFMRVHDQSLAIVFSCILLGIFALGPYPLALELIVECTYPVDQVIEKKSLGNPKKGIFLWGSQNFLTKCMYFLPTILPCSGRYSGQRVHTL
jgi:cyanate permease